MPVTLRFLFLAIPTLAIAVAQPPSKPSPKPAADQPKLKAIWEPASFPKDIRLNDIACLGPEECFAAGDKSTIIHTTDGGKTWQVRLGGDPESSDPGLVDLFFLDSSHGWALSEHGVSFASSDKGATWTQGGRASPTSRRLAFFSPQDGVARDNTQTLRTTKDGGKTWSAGHRCVVEASVDGLARKLNCDFLDLRGAGPRIAYAAAQAHPGGIGMGTKRMGVVLRTRDAGQTWSASSPPDFDAAVQRVFFWSENQGLAVLFSKKAFLTSDGGDTWTGAVSPLDYNSFYASGDGKFVVGVTEYNKLAVYSVDGGRTFTSRPLQLPARVYGLAFPAPTTGYLVGEHGMVYRYKIVPAAYSAPGMLPAMAP